MVRHLYNESSHIFASSRLLVSVSAEHCMLLWSIPELTAFRKSLFPCKPHAFQHVSVKPDIHVWFGEPCLLKKNQNSCHGSQIGYQNRMIQAILNVHVAPIPQTKFRFNLT